MRSYLFIVFENTEVEATKQSEPSTERVGTEGKHTRNLCLNAKSHFSKAVTPSYDLLFSVVSRWPGPLYGFSFLTCPDRWHVSGLDDRLSGPHWSCLSIAASVTLLVIGRLLRDCRRYLPRFPVLLCWRVHTISDCFRASSRRYE